MRDYHVLLIIILACCSHDLMIIISSYMHLLRRVFIHVQLTYHFFSTFVITPLDTNIQQSRRIYASPLLCHSYFLLFSQSFSCCYPIHQLRHNIASYFFHAKIWTDSVKCRFHILKVFILQIVNYLFSSSSYKLISTRNLITNTFTKQTNYIVLRLCHLIG